MDTAPSDNDQATLSLAERRFAFEKKQAEDKRLGDEARAKGEKVASRWTRLSIVIPLVGAIVGYFVQSAATQRNVKRRFIDQQLSELYYPVQLRLKKDSALMALLYDEKVALPIREQVQYETSLTNDLEVVRILEKHYDLVRNPYEDTNIDDLTKEIIDYEKHVTLFSALHTLKTKRTPQQVSNDFAYPVKIEEQIDRRIMQLEEQRRKVDKHWF